MTDGKARAAEPSLFQGLANSPAREATRRATRRFCKLLQSARERENRPVYLDTLAACGLSPVDSLRLLLASRSHAFSGEEKAWGIAYTPLVPQECLVA